MELAEEEGFELSRTSRNLQVIDPAFGHKRQKGEKCSPWAHFGHTDGAANRLPFDSAEIFHLHDGLGLNLSQIARRLEISARTVRRRYATAGEVPEHARRGRRFADVNATEVVRLRESGMSWRATGKKLATAPSTVREVYDRALNTTQAALIEPTPCDKSAKYIPQGELATDSVQNAAGAELDADSGAHDWLRVQAVPEARFCERRSRVTTVLLAASFTYPDSTDRFASPST